MSAHRIRWALLVGLVLSVTYAYCTADRGAHLSFVRGGRHHYSRSPQRPQYLVPLQAAYRGVAGTGGASGSRSAGSGNGTGSVAQHLHLLQLAARARPLRACNPAAMSDPAAAAATMSGSGLKESYSLWAMPKGRLGDQLRGEIAHLAGRHGGPAFPPHVTVLGDIERPREEAVRLMRELAAQVKKYRINFVDVTRGTFFYQCVFLLVAKDEGTMAAAAAARRVFGRDTPPYMPHLSLLYADLEDEEKEKEVKYERDRLYGESSGYDTLLVENGYEVGSLALWYTPTEDKSLQSWCMVDEFELSG